MSTNSELIQDRQKDILILEDDTQVSDYISFTLNSADWCGKIVSTDRLEIALRKIELTQFQLAFVDVGLPDGNGLDAIKRLNKRQPDCSSIVISVFDDENTVLQAITCGASSYLVKDALPADILRVCNDVLIGRSHISTRIAHYLIQAIQTNNKAEGCTLAAPITNREREVLEIVARGYNPREVADLLNLSYHTVASHIKNIYQKLQVSSRSEAVFEAQKIGILHI